MPWLSPAVKGGSSRHACTMHKMLCAPKMNGWMRRLGFVRLGQQHFAVQQKKMIGIGI